MNFEVKVEDDDEEDKQLRNKKTKIKKTEYDMKDIDVTIVKDARALVEEVMVARGLKPETMEQPSGRLWCSGPPGTYTPSTAPPYSGTGRRQGRGECTKDFS